MKQPTQTLKQDQQITMKIAITAMMILGLIGCGSSKESKTTSISSRLVPITVNPVVSGKKLTNCNRKSLNDIDFSSMVATSDGTTVNYQYIYVKLNSLPADFDQNTKFINFWAWDTSSTGSARLSSSALKFRIEDMNGQVLMDNLSSISYSEIKSLATKSSSIDDDMEILEFVRILVDLKDANGNYDAIKVALYNKSTKAFISMNDQLLPPFAVNPTDYAIDAQNVSRPQILQQLHPFYQMQNSGWNTTQFLGMAQEWCF